MSIKQLCPKKRLHAVQFTGPDSITDLRDLLALTIDNDEERPPTLERDVHDGCWWLCMPNGTWVPLTENDWVVRHFGRRFSVAANARFHDIYEILP